MSPTSLVAKDKKNIKIRKTSTSYSSRSIRGAKKSKNNLHAPNSKPDVITRTSDNRIALASVEKTNERNCLECAKSDCKDAARLAQLR